MIINKAEECVCFLLLFITSTEYKSDFIFQDWDKGSTPLAAKGKEPKYVKPADKVSATEGDNAYFFLDIVGDPIPTVTWFKVKQNIFERNKRKSL